MKIYLVCDICQKVIGLIEGEALTEKAKKDIINRGNEEMIYTLCSDCRDELTLQESVLDYLREHIIN